MMSNGLQKMMLLLSLGMALVLFSGMSSFAAVVFDVDAIDAEIAAAVVAGEEPVLASKNAVENAVLAMLEANADYPGGPEALKMAVLDALAGLNITGLDTVDIWASGCHALGIEVDTDLEAYQDPDAPEFVSPGSHEYWAYRFRKVNNPPAGQPAFLKKVQKMNLQCVYKHFHPASPI